MKSPYYRPWLFGEKEEFPKILMKSPYYNVFLQNGEKFSTRTEELLSSSFALGSNSKSVKKVGHSVGVVVGCGFTALVCRLC